ncbi:MAG TPA: hypothetical protein VK527_02050, partial [Candidatus Limnocylindrales bacterium]|nr:hypothetical protein [Candidatus Limnocylindrales bacterium]
MPGSPEPDDLNPKPSGTRALHPLAWLVSLALIASALAMARSWIDLAAAAGLLAFAALRAESRPARSEIPILGLALIVFLAHVV